MGDVLTMRPVSRDASTNCPTPVSSDATDTEGGRSGQSRARVPAIRRRLPLDGVTNPDSAGACNSGTGSIITVRRWAAVGPATAVARTVDVSRERDRLDICGSVWYL